MEKPAQIEDLPKTESMPGTDDWNALASCKGEDPRLFFGRDKEDGGESPPVRDARVAMAKAICTNCTVLSVCLANALERPEKYGIWGGMTEKERKKLLSGRSNAAKRRSRLEALTEQRVVNQ